MRRGLMAWDADEIPIEALKQRVQRLQNAMAAAGQDGILLYTNFIRSGAVSYLTAFSPYWADGILLVPQKGEPVFATTLSKRVGSWIQTVKPIGELVASPTPGTFSARNWRWAAIYAASPFSNSIIFRPDSMAKSPRRFPAQRSSTGLQVLPWRARIWMMSNAVFSQNANPSRKRR